MSTSEGSGVVDDSVAAETESPRPPRSMWLLSENRRSAITTVLAAGVAIVLQRWVINDYEDYRDLVEVDLFGAALLLPVMVWAWYAIAHVVLTLFAYAGLRGERFRAAVTADPSWLRSERRTDSGRRRRWRRWFAGVGPAIWSISLAVFALVAVVALVTRPALRELPLSYVVALVLVAMAWISVAITFAVHYARVDSTRGGLAFPGDGPESLIDYVYLAAGVQATFGTTDVEVRSRELRTQVLSQSVLAFVFNTVIVGMVISVLLSG